jgi:hypothetical protein
MRDCLRHLLFVITHGNSSAISPKFCRSRTFKSFICNVIANGNISLYLAISVTKGMRLLAFARKKMRRGLRSAVSVFFLLFYVAGVTSQSQGFHQFFHSKNNLVSHTEAQEKDRCHRSIYHDDVKTGCGHSSHVVVTDKCPLCDQIFHIDQILTAEYHLSSHFGEAEFTIIEFATEPLRIVVLPARAPPFHSIFS